MKQNKSMQLWDEAQQLLSGDDNSPVRAFTGPGGRPLSGH